MQTFFRSSATLSFLTLLASGCGSLEPAAVGISLDPGAPLRLRSDLADVRLATPPARDTLALTTVFTPAPGTWSTPPETTPPPADPPTPVDCHDGLAIAVPSTEALRVLSFAGTLDSWAATYTVTSSSGEETTYFVALDAQGRPFGPPQTVPLGTRLASFRYEVLLVGPSVAEPFLAVADSRGREVSRVTDPSVWGAALDPEARVLDVHGAPSRCAYEATVVLGSAAGRSVVRVHLGSEGTPVTERLLELAPVPDGSTSVLAVSTAEVLDVLTPDAGGGIPHVRIYRPSVEGWALAREIEAWTDGPGRPVAATRTWSGWSVLGASLEPGVPSELVELRDDGTSAPPIAVADYERCGSGLGSIAASNDTALFAVGARVGGLHYGTLTAQEHLPLPSALVAPNGSGELAAVGVGPDGVSMRCYRADSLRAPAP